MWTISLTISFCLIRPLMRLMRSKTQASPLILSYVDAKRKKVRKLCHSIIAHRSVHHRKEPVPDMTSVQTYQHSWTGKKDRVRKKVLINEENWRKIYLNRSTTLVSSPFIYRFDKHLICNLDLQKFKFLIVIQKDLSKNFERVTDASKNKKGIIHDD